MYKTKHIIGGFLTTLFFSPTSLAQEAIPPIPPFPEATSKSISLTASQVFAFADAACDKGDFDVAEAAYRALATHADIELRTEARFRLGLMFANRMGRPRQAAIEFRRILDDKPNAVSVRLELARVDILLGRLGSAEREFRAAQASGELPPDVERTVRFYSSALASTKPLGGSIELSMAPDSNINRATRSDTLRTVIGDFTVNDDARAKAGLGIAARISAFGRLPLGSKSRLLAKLSGSADVYRFHEADDYVLALQLGPEFLSGADRFTFSVGPSWRWYGQKPFTRGLGVSSVYQHPLGSRSQLRYEVAISRQTNMRNASQDANVYENTGTLDRAFSSRFGGGVQLRLTRISARDPGWSNWHNGATIYIYREAKRTTFMMDVGYSRLKADERLTLFPYKRADNFFAVGLGATFRAIQYKGFAPFVKIRLERNQSSVGIYQFTRKSAEFGITSAF